MKKLLVIFSAIFLISKLSYADNGIFISADYNHSNSWHKAKNSAVTGPKDRAVTKGNDSGWGASVGYRFDPLLFYVAPELFYDSLGTDAPILPSSGPVSDRIEVSDRYGAKINAGLTILPWFTPYATFGLTNVHYSINNKAVTSKTSFNLAPIYGVGLLFDLPLTDLSARVSYDYQEFADNSPTTNAKIKTRLGTTKLGLTYTF